jgi:leucyl/phenylalanyl-tRNA---protein transferase
VKRLNETGPFWLDPEDPQRLFPDVSLALRDPDGLLAMGGDLSVERLLQAYRSGIFPWFGPRQPILWWSPDPRLVLFPEALRISRSLSRVLRRNSFAVTLDTAFEAVIEQCAVRRPGQAGTWITAEMRSAYLQLHAAGHAHSVECWQEGVLVGGLYGVAVGRIFFGESMFTRANDASKVAFVRLVQQLRDWDFPLVDCQVHTRHLESLGATGIPRDEFVQWLSVHCARDPVAGRWQFDGQTGI